MGEVGIWVSVLVGRTGGADTAQVKRVFVHQRENPIVNRLNKTRVERKPDLREEKEERDKVLRRQQQASQQERVCLHPLLHIPYFPYCPRRQTKR